MLSKQYTTQKNKFRKNLMQVQKQWLGTFYVLVILLSFPLTTHMKMQFNTLTTKASARSRTDTLNEAIRVGTNASETMSNLLSTEFTSSAMHLQTQPNIQLGEQNKTAAYMKLRPTDSRLRDARSIENDSSGNGKINRNSSTISTVVDNIECPSFDESSACPCYTFEDGLFLECPGITSLSLRSTLQRLSAPVNSLSIYDFDRSVSSLSQDVFQPGINIKHLQFSHSHLETLKENSLKSLRTSLESLSIVNSKLTQG